MVLSIVSFCISAWGGNTLCKSSSKINIVIERVSIYYKPWPPLTVDWVLRSLSLKKYTQLKIATIHWLYLSKGQSEAIGPYLCQLKQYSLSDLFCTLQIVSFNLINWQFFLFNLVCVASWKMRRKTLFGKNWVRYKF